VQKTFRRSGTCAVELDDTVDITKRAINTHSDDRYLLGEKGTGEIALGMRGQSGYLISADESVSESIITTYSLAKVL